MAFSYTDLELTVRPDLQDAYREAWQRLARPGNWWTGSQRIAIAAESRNAFSCSLCRRRKGALSPYTVQGEHDHLGQLPDTAVDVIHQVITDQQRISKHWVGEILDRGLSDGEYVELLGVVVMVFSIDEFNRGIGAPLEPLPEPEPGEPDHYRPKNTEFDTGFVPMIAKAGATGGEADLWGKDDSVNVIRAMSLVPNAVRDLILLAEVQYIPIEEIPRFDENMGRSLSRMQIELVASRIAALNECYY